MALKKKQIGDPKRPGNTRLSVGIWVLAFVVVLGLFVALLPKMLKTMEATGFVQNVLGGKKEASNQRNAADEKTVVGDFSLDPSAQVRPTTPIAPPAPQTSADVTIVQAASAPSESVPPAVSRFPETDVQQTAESPAAQNGGQPQAVTAVPTGQTQLRVWFVEIKGDGSVSRKEMVRDSPATDSPLTASIWALLSGPNAAERTKGCDTLIPDGTKLISAVVKNGVANLNFSDEFQYNRYGVEGYMGQLMQIVYTATAFPSVDSVQFLVEGERGEYIGSEGVWIGSPLSRSSFR